MFIVVLALDDSIAGGWSIISRVTVENISSDRIWRLLKVWNLVNPNSEE